MHFSKIHSAVLLVLALGAVASPAMSAGNDPQDGGLALKKDLWDGEHIQLAAAEGGSAASAPEAASKPSSSPEESVDTSMSTLGGGMSSSLLFGSDASTSVSQQSATPGYELGGAGVASGRAPTQGAIMTSPAKGAPIRFDNGVYIYPSALLGFGHNDNITSAATNQISSSFWVLRPEAVAELKTRGDRYTVSYLGNYGRYTNSSADNYDHHEFWAAADNYLTTRARIGWGVGYLDQTDARGSTNNGISALPDHWTAPVIRAMGVYGAPGAIGRFEVDGSRMQKRYQNNRTTTQASDVDISNAAARFFYRFMPKTSAVLEVRNTWSNYVSSTSTQDNSDRRIYAGLVWEATAKTTGTIKVGRAYKDFVDASRNDAGMASWEGGLRWSPLTYSSVDLAASRAPQDSTGVGNFSVNKATSLTWNHQWASFISSRVNAGTVKTDYSGDPRSDSTNNYGIGFYRNLGYRTRLGLDWNHTKRDSNQDVNDFKRNTMMLTLEAVL